MRFVTFEIPDIVGKGRPRMSRRTGTVYTPVKTRDYEKLVRGCFRLATVGKGWDATANGYQLIATCYFPIPKSWTKAKRLQALKNEIHPKKPDLDNILKAVMDALNGLAYTDDSQVFSATITKSYSGMTDGKKIIVEIFAV